MCTATGGGHWFERWFDENYLKLYRHRDTADADRQIRLILDTLSPTPADRILDLGCGEGRHAAKLHAMGLNVTGMDLSETLIRLGRQKYPDVPLQVGDMRQVTGPFDIILSLFTSFGYFDQDETNRQVMTAMAHALNPGGWLWLDFLNPGFVQANLEPETRKTLPDGTPVRERRRIENRQVIKDIRFDAGEAAKTYQERVYLYERHELERMMNENDIVIHGAFGNYTGSNWSNDAPRTILYGRKHEQ